MLMTTREFEKLLSLVEGELFYLERKDMKDTEEFLMLKKIEKKLLKLLHRKED